MYKRSNRLSIDDFAFPYGTLCKDSRRVRLAGLIGWERAEREHASHAVNSGAPAHPARTALGALIAKQMPDCPDRDLVGHVEENPYLQFFTGMKGYSGECPFGAPAPVAFRCRFTEGDTARINGWAIGAAGAREADEGDSDNGGGGGTGSDSVSVDGDDKGALCLDAAVTPSNIRYPTDTPLLNEAGEKLEGIIDRLRSQTGAKRPRAYRRRAGKDCLSWSKPRKETAGTTRKAHGRQPGYAARDLRHIGCLPEKGAVPDETDAALLEAICALFAQRLSMHTERVSTVSDRIASIEQPWVRPMVRGKTARKAGFGAKVHVVCEGGFARIACLPSDAFSGAEGLTGALEDFKKRTGAYPERVCADRICRNRKNLAWCKERGIAVSGPKLGRPPKDGSPPKG